MLKACLNLIKLALRFQNVIRKFDAIIKTFSIFFIMEKNPPRPIWIDVETHL